MVNLHSYDAWREASTVTLSNGWRFVADEDGALSLEDAECLLAKRGIEQSIPSVWNYVEGLFDYEGVGWYTREFTAEAGKHKLIFEGACNDCEVWVDGVRVASHIGAFLGFASYLDFSAPARHILTVRVSNLTNEKNTVPASKCDWKRYGGIIRPVRLTRLPEAHIDGIELSYSLSDDLGRAFVRIRVDFYGEEAKSYSLLVNGEAVGEYLLGKGENTIDFTVDSPKLWDIGCGNLYYVTLRSNSDSETVRTGFRRVGIRNGRITLNGREIVLKGVNRHEERADVGHALSLSATEQDIELITELGSNTVRGSHYPNSRDMLDLCDERGPLFWSELPLWQYTEAQAMDSDITDTTLRLGREMILENMHHPSIFVWGLHNECETETEAFRLLSEKMARLYRSLDASRLITFATDRALTDICLEYCDFISVNRYPGWYNDDVSEWRSFIADLRSRMGALGIGDKPIVVSEFGAGAIPGYSSPYKVKWSEELQVDILSESIEIFADLSLAGVLVWQFADIRVSAERALYRPRCFNNKGLVDENRRKKPSFKSVREKFALL